MKWKYFKSNTRGLSHIKDNTHCQDAINTITVNINGVDYFIAAVCDGAGSKKLSEVSAKFLCCALLFEMQKWLENSNIEDFSKENLLEIIYKYRKVLQKVAQDIKLESINEYACTMLFAVLSEKVNIFAQIGDGAIVIKNNDDIDYVFEFQKGEYINTTHFATDKNFEENLMFQKTYEEVKQLSMHTDGIESVSCDFSNKKPFKPFYLPFFNELEKVNQEDEIVELSSELDEFLNSDRINEKTADDKTVIFVEKIG